MLVWFFMNYHARRHETRLRAVITWGRGLALSSQSILLYEFLQLKNFAQ